MESYKKKKFLRSSSSKPLGQGELVKLSVITTGPWLRLLAAGLKHSVFWAPAHLGGDAGQLLPYSKKRKMRLRRKMLPPAGLAGT